MLLFIHLLCLPVALLSPHINTLIYLSSTYFSPEQAEQQEEDTTADPGFLEKMKVAIFQVRVLSLCTQVGILLHVYTSRYATACVH